VAADRRSARSRVSAVPRVRRPLLALIVLLVAVAIGYAVDALSGGDSGPSQPTPTVSVSR
jgi:hypothetical protein